MDIGGRKALSQPVARLVWLEDDGFSDFRFALGQGAGLINRDDINFFQLFSAAAKLQNCVALKLHTDGGGKIREFIGSVVAHAVNEERRRAIDAAADSTEEIAAHLR